MLIQTENTPNHNTIKFLPGFQILENSQTIVINSKQEADEISPMAESLFLIDGISSIFIADNFISISKSEDSDWLDLKPKILTSLLEHFSSNLPIFSKSANLDTFSSVDEFYDKKDQVLVDKIKELISERVRPFIKQDGGDIIFKGFKDGTVYLVLLGACSGCSSASVTLYQGIQNLLMHYIPEVKGVEPLN